MTRNTSLRESWPDRSPQLGFCIRRLSAERRNELGSGKRSTPQDLRSAFRQVDKLSGPRSPSQVKAGNGRWAGSQTSARRCACDKQL
jgi:hypothetical protein